ncbi:tRNA (guanosine(46)-N7)-methyltransferase TrmB [Tahibacter amnicola]|uniref:tRNA (guanine-N(7)-)-methyltransferase n=1 Tax=Tahibacter amnicola TaxID=2976241 RepID=A0ABY6BIC7_9GAMM|nr:tRNA (guanosine(46)-N7)-methyltransferase TrmB [Tahibacter amnicola]UXI69262.1 tRNA (guanosine(46)-N7)-methyltransferase TrmB [Tahibacter amnicola]
MKPGDGDQTGDDASRPQRRIRSFVLRQGRITPAQERAFAAHWPRYGLDFTGQPRDLAAVFGNQRPVALEIGFGNGEQLAFGAAHEPAMNFIGVEVHRPGVGRALNALAAQDSSNARVYHHDAVEVLTQELAPASLAQVRIYFPDPWHKKRHNKRRLVQPELVALLATRVARGGCLHLATDWADYAEQMMSVVQADTAWRNRAGTDAYSPRPDWRTETHFEKRGLRLGHGVWDLIFDRV